MRATRIKLYLALIASLALVAAYWQWRIGYGITGNVRHIDFNTRDYIAFVRQAEGRSDIYVVRADGEDLRQLTDDKAYERAPAWSPDGKRICYAAQAEEGTGLTYQLFLLGEGSPRQATTGSIDKDLPSWRSDGKKIAYLSGGAIKTMNPNGEDTEQIYPRPTRSTSKGGEDDAASSEVMAKMLSSPINHYRFSPDGKSIAARQETEGENAPAIGQQRWWEKQSNDGDAQPSALIAEPESVIVLPSVSSDAKPFLAGDGGAQKVFYDWFFDSARMALSFNTRRFDSVLFIIRTDDRLLPKKVLLFSRAMLIAVENIAVSPDGTKVAFELWKLDSEESRTLLGIAVIPTDLQEVLKIESAADIAKIPLIIRGDAHQPKWSPDGTRLLYWKSGTGGRDLWVCRADGSNPVNITKGVGDNSDAVWSPLK
jgi:TolB protein